MSDKLVGDPKMQAVQQIIDLTQQLNSCLEDLALDDETKLVTVSAKVLWHSVPYNPDGDIEQYPQIALTLTEKLGSV